MGLVLRELAGDDIRTDVFFSLFMHGMIWHGVIHKVDGVHYIVLLCLAYSILMHAARPLCISTRYIDE